jgi:hypothetical protein
LVYGLGQSIGTNLGFNFGCDRFGGCVANSKQIFKQTLSVTYFDDGLSNKFEADFWLWHILFGCFLEQV